MKKWIQLLSVLLLLLSEVSAGVPDAVSKNISNAVEIGETRLTFLFWDVYDITLYAKGDEFNPDKPFALRLHYLRDLKGKAIAERSIEEMRRQGISEVKLAAWYSQLVSVFPDVEKGTDLTGIFIPGEPTRFYKDGQFIGQVLDPDFRRPFSNIWLGEQSSVPRIREQLVNRSMG